MLRGKGDELSHNSCDAVMTEKKKWNEVNTSLCHLKFSPVSILSFDEFHTNQMKDFLVLSCNDSRNLRKAVEVLIKDGSRRQLLHQGLLKDNFQLREELKKKESEIIELEKDLSESSRRPNQGVKVNNGQYFEMKSDEDSQECMKCVSLEEEVMRLRREIKSSKADIEKQKLKSVKVFEELTGISGKEKIDENNVKKLKELLTAKVPHDMSVPSSSFKLLIKSYESKLEEYKKRIMSLQEGSIGSSKADLQIRSSRISARTKSNFFPDSEYNTPRSDETSTTRTSTKLVDLKQQSSFFCQKYLEMVCKELSICDLDDIQPTLRKLSVNCQESLKYERFFKEVAQLTATANIPRKPCRHHSEDSPCINKDCVISTLEYWTFQMKHLKNLQESIENLSEKLFPWKPMKLINGVCSSSELVGFVDRLIDAGCCGRDCRKEDLKNISREQLAGIVGHFQELFDVPQVEGVYSKMSHLYRKLGENYNFISNIKDILGLGRSSSSKLVIEKISKLQNVISDKKVESLLEKLELQDVFCSTFQETMQELMGLLGVNTIGQIPPAVKRLVNRRHLDSDSSTFC